MTLARFNQARAYFKEDLSRLLSEAKASEEVTTREGFWIGYDNNLKVLEGYTLRQAALLERARRTVVKRPGPVTQKFCNVLLNSRYLD